MYAAKKAAGASPYSMRGPSSSGSVTPMMSPAPQDAMGYSLGGGGGGGSGNGYEQQQPYDMGYDHSLHQDLSP